MLASGSTDCQPNHHGLMELFDCLCCHHSFLTFKINYKLKKIFRLTGPLTQRNLNLPLHACAASQFGQSDWSVQRLRLRRAEVSKFCCDKRT